MRIPGVCLHTFTRILNANRVAILTAIFVLAVPGLSTSVSGEAGSPAQQLNFYQTGKIRPVVSELRTGPQEWKNRGRLTSTGFRTDKTSKVDFYFAYSVPENGIRNEKWILLPNDAAWSGLSNQTVRLTGTLSNNRLSSVRVTALTKLSAEELTNPIPTMGIYKVVAVPLTVQPQSASGRNVKTSANPEATPEAIRDVFFNLPDAVNKFYLEASYGKFAFTGVHHPQIDVVPTTIQATISNDCQNQIITEFTPIVSQRLLDQNIDTTNGSVDLGIIIINDMPGCPNYPFTNRGKLGERGVPFWLWMPESWFVTGPAIMAHEIGHTLGANHPAAIRCKDFDDPDNCVIDANVVDRSLMSFGGARYLMPSNFERRRWGWHPPGAFDSPATVPFPMFDLFSPALPAVKDGMRQGRFFYRHILTGIYTGGWGVYPEARRNLGQFENYPGIDEAFRMGVTVRIGHSNYGDPSALSVVLDPNNTPELDDAPLRENQQIVIGGTVTRCLREFNPLWGTRMESR